ncbi:hypothetical protein [Fodinicola feengrottensis]|uniref:hypothetical protein n=1 Tax=Fodinicola feengrottensis TaxID=435914 RepID=UPI0013D3AFAB|nr:hypothetical protein [Fodinicola feengrottensis]
MAAPDQDLQAHQVGHQRHRQCRRQREKQRLRAVEQDGDAKDDADAGGDDPQPDGDHRDRPPPADRAGPDGDRADSYRIGRFGGLGRHGRVNHQHSYAPSRHPT